MPGERSSEVINMDALKSEGITLAALPVLATALWKSAIELGNTSPYLCPLILMVVLTYAALFFQTKEKEIQTRLIVDAVVISATVLYGRTAYPLDGPPTPETLPALMQSFVGILCIIATVRAILFTISGTQNYINKH